MVTRSLHTSSAFPDHYYPGLGPAPMQTSPLNMAVGEPPAGGPIVGGGLNAIPLPLHLRQPEHGGHGGGGPPSPLDEGGAPPPPAPSQQPQPPNGMMNCGGNGGGSAGGGGGVNVVSNGGCGFPSNTSGSSGSTSSGDGSPTGGNRSLGSNGAEHESPECRATPLGHNYGGMEWRWGW